MQVIETSRDGLMRQFKVVVSAGDIESKVATRLDSLSREVRVPGFRPGKIPMSMMRKRYGQAVIGEVLEKTVDDSSRDAIASQGLRPALQPKIEITAFGENQDLEYTMSFEVLPEVPTVDLKSIEVERPVVAVGETEIDNACARIATRFRKAEPVDPPRAAANGDVVEIDFAGRVDGVAFDGGTAEGFDLELGEGRMIPGFEAAILGMQPGEVRVVPVTFPEDYGAKHLAGKLAEFTITVKQVKARMDRPIDDAFAKDLGLESLAALRERVKDDIAREYAGAARMRVKRSLLDALAKRVDFAVPNGMIEAEFDGIWRQLKAEIEGGGPKPDKDEPALQAEYRAIAERRVRLGLVLAEIGRGSNLQVTPEDLSKAVMEEARRYPGQERQVVEFYSKNQDAVASLRAPIYEDKVVDYMLEMVKVTDRAMTATELLADDEAQPPSTGAAA